MNNDTYIIIPVYNEGIAISQVVTELQKDFANIVCVNDGSRDSSSEAILDSGATLVEHTINLGQGAALQTGIAYALQDSKAKYFITFDADGQHDVGDAKKMLAHIKEHNLDVVLGSRFLGVAKDVGKYKKIFLKMAVLFSNTTTGLKLTDAHNGLRVLSRKVAEGINIEMPDMAHASEIIHKIAHNKYSYAELPVTITYNDYSRAKGQSMINAINITFDLLIHRGSKK